jgi:ribosomal protein S18 acetylase RimI-like enzyme
MSELRIKPVENLAEALQIAEVRNSGRDYLTNDGEYISANVQAVWYDNVYLDKHSDGELDAYIGHEYHLPVAYGMIAYKDKALWLTGVIAPEYQGRGYGRTLFDFLANTANETGETVMLDVLNSNERARRLYDSLGFMAVGGDERKTIMELRR